MEAKRLFQAALFGCALTFTGAIHLQAEEGKAPAKAAEAASVTYNVTGMT